MGLVVETAVRLARGYGCDVMRNWLRRWLWKRLSSWLRGWLRSWLWSRLWSWHQSYEYGWGEGWGIGCVFGCGTGCGVGCGIGTGVSVIQIFLLDFLNFSLVSGLTAPVGRIFLRCNELFPTKFCHIFARGFVFPTHHEVGWGDGIE